MPPKQQLDKAAWQWAEVTDWDKVNSQHIKMAYRLNLLPCSQGSCKRNCKGNPFCINCLGEKVWFGEIREDSWHDIEDPNEERRKDKAFVGLKNLGATCYVNTFLQLWFHSPEIRRAIYRYRETDITADYNILEGWKPSSIGGHLQVIFAMLELSERAYVSPQDFINHLGLDAALQQDAQEFSKLFLSLLEDSLSQQKDPSVRNVIQSQFCGEYAYVTTCKNCRKASHRPSMFYELDLHIKGHKTLEDSIEDFLQEEKLDGNNKYMCSYCCSKQDASRAIQLKHLPPVLNIQLLRFVFDMKSGQKRKLNSFIQFPEVLDMSSFLQKREPDGTNGETSQEENISKLSTKYNLRAVLIHRGPSAYSGHYIAHIKDMKQGSWYRFNDEEIKKMKGASLHLGTEEDLEESANKQKGRVPKGYHSSRNAYMLVYTRANNTVDKDENVTVKSSCNEKEISDTGMKNEEDYLETVTNKTNNENLSEKGLLPEYVQRYVQEDNNKFEMWIAEMIMMRDQNIENGKEKQEEVKATFKKLFVDSDKQAEGEFEWICPKWISKWLADPTKASEIDNSNYLCPHKKLDPDCAVKLKCVNVRGAEVLYEKYSGGPRLHGEKSTCLICVGNRCRIIRTKQKMLEDDKMFSGMKKDVNPMEEKCFWVGKSSMRSWKRLVLEQIEEMAAAERKKQNCNRRTVSESEIEEQEMEKVGKEMNGDFTDPLQQKQDNENYNINDVSSGGNESLELVLQFNEDLLCQYHGELDPDVSCRKLIPLKIWTRLREYFPNCPEYGSDATVCSKCCTMIQVDQENKDVNKRLAVAQKQVLGELFNDRKRPQKFVHGQELNVVSASFVEEWRKFIRDPLKNSPVSEVSNTILLCKHEGYVHPPMENPPELSNTNVVYVWPTEWDIICQNFIVDLEISVVPYQGEERLLFATLPEVCKDCVNARNNEMEMAKYEYKDATLYIRKIPKESKSKNNSISESISSKDEDPEYMQLGNVSDLEEPPDKMLKLDNGVRRKSSRHRKVRGEKEVKVSSTQTLKDLKLQIMKLFSVPPFDQNLFLDGVPLKENTTTLSELKVAPGAIILLQADEPDEDPGVLQDWIQVSSGPEEGFKGSLLTTAGLVISAFVRNINYVIVSMGIISGFGACLSIATSEVVIGFNFVRHRNLASGIAVSGTGVGTLIFTPLMQMAKDYYGYTGLFLMCGALTLQQVIFGALSRPSTLEIKSKDHTKNGLARKALSDFFQSFRLLKRVYFAFLCLSLTASAFGIFMMHVQFSSLVLQQGTTKTEAANFLSVSGACNALSRFLVGIASNSDNINELLLYSGCFSIIGLATLAIPLYINYYGGQIAFAVILGTYSGCCYTLLNSITIKLVGIENLAMAYGTEFLAGGIGAVSGPVILGFLVDAGLTYAEAFMVAGFSVLVRGIFGGSVSCFDKGRASKVYGDGRSQQQNLVNRNEGVKDNQAPLKTTEVKHTTTTDNDTSTYI